MIYQRQGSKVWQARWTEDGKTLRKSLDTTDKDEALKLFYRLTGESNETEFSTVAKAWAESLALETRKGVAAKPEYAQRLNTAVKTIGKFFDGLSISDIDEQRIAVFKRDRGVKESTLRLELGYLVSILRYAQKEGFITRIPTVKKPGKATEEPKALSLDEVKKLLVEVEKPGWEGIKPAIYLGLFAGLRIGEIRTLTWRDVEIGSGFIRIQPKILPNGERWTPKSGTSCRTVPISADLAPVLETCWKNQNTIRKVLLTDNVVSRTSVRNDPYNRRVLLREIKSLWEDAGLVDENVRSVCHRLRHTMATLFLAGGGNLGDLRSLLGHSSIATTSIYSGSLLSTKRAGLDAIGSMVKVTSEPRSE